MSAFSGVAIGLGVVVIVAALFWLQRRRSDPRVCLTAAERALAEGQLERAAKLFAKAIRILSPEAASRSTAERQELLARAESGLGITNLRRNQTTDAFDHFRKAKAAGATLPAEGSRLLAEQYAAGADGSDEAVAAYLAYLQLPTTGDTAGRGRVVAALEKLCPVDETNSALTRRKAIELNRRVLEVSPDIEWAHYFLGVGSLIDGNMPRASEHLSRALSLNSERPLTHYWLAVCRLQDRESDLEDAIRLMEEFLAYPLESRRAVKRQAAGAHEIGKRLVATVGGFDQLRESATPQAGAVLARAMRFFALATQRQPDNAEYQFNFARGALLAGDDSRGISSLEAAVRLAPSQNEYAFRLGLEQERRGDHASAISTFQQVVQRESDHVEAHRRLAELCLRVNDDAGAEVSSRNVLRLQQADPRFLSILILALFRQSKITDVVEQAQAVETKGLEQALAHEAAIAAGRSFARCGNFAKAIAWYERVQSTPGVPYSLGCAHAHAGHFEDALSCFDRARSQGGDSVSVLLQRGHVLRALGRLLEAGESYRSAASLDQRNPEVPYSLGGLALECGDLVAASQAFARAIEIAPSHFPARLGAGIVAERQGNTIEAIEFYESVTSDARLASIVTERLGVLNYRQGKYSEALRWLAPAPESEAVLFYRGAALLGLGRAEDGLAAWTELQKRHPDDERLRLNVHRAHYQHGTTSLESGRLSEAIAAWKKYLERYAMDEKVTRDVGSLEFRQAVSLLLREPADIAGAAKHIGRATELDQSNELYQFYAALCDLSLGRPAECLERLKGLTSASTATPRVVYHLGVCLLRMEQREHGRGILTQLMNSNHRGGYAQWAAWAVANEEVRDGQHLKATEILAAATAQSGVEA